MRFLTSGLVSCLLLGAAPARAVSTAEDACTPDFAAMVRDIQADCDALAVATARKSELQATLADAENNRGAIAELNAEIHRLEQATPLLARGICTARRRNCETLGSLLSVQLVQSSLHDLDETNGASAASANLALVEGAAELERQTSNNTSGSLAQLDPVEALQPITVAGGAIALSGTRSGTKGIGTITINPLALAAAPADVISGRVLDLAVSAPFDLDQGSSQGQQYVSVRFRVNLMAPFSADPLQAKVTKWLAAEGRHADDLEEVFQRTASVRRCAEYVARTNHVSKEACGEDLSNDEVAAARAAAYADIDDARRAADRHYLGLDIRLDTGDPTGSDIVGDDGTHLLGGLGAGARLSQGARWGWELRGRVAADYFESRGDGLSPPPEPVYSVDWGAAFILSGRLDSKPKQRMAFGVGLEGRHAGNNREDAGETPTNYAYLNLMTVVPALSGGDLGLAISVPLAERGVKRGALISFSTALGLLDHSSAR
jgi:hypothetical protein